MKKRHLTPILLAFIGLAALSFTTATGVTLRLHPSKTRGQASPYTITSKATMMTMMEVQGQSINSNQTVETRQSFSAKEVTDEQIVIETQVEAIKMSVSQMGMKLEYDSEHPEKASPMLAGQTKDIEKNLKKPVTVTYDVMGKVIGDPTTLEMNQLSNAIIELPEEELTVGSKWSREKTQSLSGTEIKVNMEYTVTDISKKSVDVSFTGNIDSKEASGTYNGTASFNPQTGLITNSTTKVNISMTISEQGLSLPVTMVGTTTVEVK